MLRLHFNLQYWIFCVLRPFKKTSWSHLQFRLNNILKLYISRFIVRTQVFLTERQHVFFLD